MKRCYKYIFAPESASLGSEASNCLDVNAGRIANAQQFTRHKRVRTTLSLYAKLDERSVIDRWQTYLAHIKARNPEGF